MLFYLDFVRFCESNIDLLQNLSFSFEFREEKKELRELNTKDEFKAALFSM